MKTILVTGANRGLGLEIVRQAGLRGAYMYISGRNESSLRDALKKIRNEKILASIVQIDVSSDESVRKAAGKLSETGTRLDVIVNNAGIVVKGDRSLLNSEPELLMKTLDTNALGALRVTRAFLPLMNTPGRIINISSGGGSMSDPVGGWSPAYCTSKTLLNAITRHLAWELSGKGISVNAVCPGWVRTDMGGRSAPRNVEKGAETPVWLALDAPQELTGEFIRDKKIIPW